MTFEPYFLTTHVGSVPYPSVEGISEKIASWLDIPAWPQFSRRTFHENMYVQYTASLPRMVLDEPREKITADTTGDLTPDLEAFYERYLADDVDAFALRPDYAAGFFAMLEVLRATPGDWGKGQVTGPVSLGLTVVDQDLRSILYNEMLADAIVKNAVMNARWQARELHAVRPNVIIFADEPYMASFGSAFISLSREQAIGMLDEVFAGIHQEDALAGVHCCANTDWSVLLGTSVDILNLDAYGYIENLALYPAELRAFLDRGGVVAWGIVPNTEELYEVTPESLAHELRAGIRLISEKAAARGVTITVEELEHRSLIAPACGMGPTTVDVADLAFEMLGRTKAILQNS
jgi:hypothetical protein